MRFLGALSLLFILVQSRALATTCGPILDPQNQALPSLIIAANRLPVTLRFEREGLVASQASGGVVSALRTIGHDFQWTGWPGMQFEREQHAEIIRFLSHADRDIKLEPVFLTPSQKHFYYDEFANRDLWPIFHGLHSFGLRQITGWSDYRQVNQKFARALFSRIKTTLSTHSGSDPLLVWIHDYQLMLVANDLRGMLREVGLENRVRIGFFLHIPFPSLENFMRLPHEIRIALLEGILASDQIGFHTKEYLDHFRDAVNFENPRQNARPARVGEMPIGIDPNAFRDALKTEEAQETLRQLKEKFDGYRVVLGVERLDPIKGILEKLRGYERFLETNPEAVGKTVLMQIAEPSRQDIPEYTQLLAQTRELVDRINRRFTIEGRLSPVEFRDRGIRINELVAYYRVADAALITSLKDGMNLVALEFTAVQEGRGENSGVLILSKNAGAARWLDGAVKTDPLSIDDVASALRTGLAMKGPEKAQRTAVNLKHVEANTASVWAKDFLEGLR